MRRMSTVNWYHSWNPHPHPTPVIFKEVCYHSYVEWMRNSMEMSYSSLHDNSISRFIRQEILWYLIKVTRFIASWCRMSMVSPESTTKIVFLVDRTICRSLKLFNITYEWENSATGKTSIVHVNYLKDVRSDGVSENQYISDSG